MNLSRFIKEQIERIESAEWTLLRHDKKGQWLILGAPNREEMANLRQMIFSTHNSPDLGESSSPFYILVVPETGGLDRVMCLS